MAYYALKSRMGYVNHINARGVLNIKPWLNTELLTEDGELLHRLADVLNFNRGDDDKLEVVTVELIEQE